MTTSTITDVLYEPALEKWPAHPGLCGVGIVINDREVMWSGHGAGPTAVLPVGWAGHAREVIHTALVGQSLDESGLLDLLHPLQEADTVALLNQMPGLLESVERVLVNAWSGSHRRSVTDGLMRSLPTSAPRNLGLPRLILEVDNEAATAGLVQTIIDLQPDGLGYRLVTGSAVENIGRQAEYLQRFVRELGLLLVGRDYPADDPPIIYLALNGALGELTADPWRELGHMLGHATGLEKAAGAVPLWLEDPMVIDDEVLHAAALNQLRDYMRVRKMRARVIGRAHTASLDDLQMLCETDAIDGACLQRGDWLSLTTLLAAVGVLQTAGKQVILRAGERPQHDEIAFVLHLGQAIGAAAILIGTGASGATTAAEAIAVRRRHQVWQAHKATTGAS